MEKIYVSGKITGNDNYREQFAKAQDILQLKKYSVVNPVAVGDVLRDTMLLELGREPTWEEYMKKCLLSMMRCSSIYMLQGWQDSKGATIEHNLAKDLGFMILYQGGENA